MKINVIKRIVEFITLEIIYNFCKEISGFSDLVKTLMLVIKV